MKTNREALMGCKTCSYAIVLILIIATPMCMGRWEDYPRINGRLLNGLHGQSDVSSGAVFTYQFDFEVDESTVTRSTFFIQETPSVDASICIDGDAIDAVIDCSFDTCTLMPKIRLTPSTMYTACLTPQIMYTNNATAFAGFSAKFTTMDESADYALTAIAR